MDDLCFEGSIRGFFKRSRCRFRPRGDGGGNGVQIPKHIDWVIWRLVVNKIASLQEIDTHYDLTEVFDANEALDLQADVAQLQRHFLFLLHLLYGSSRHLR